MTTTLTTPTARAVPPSRAGSHRLTPLRVLRSEWIKLTTTRSTLITLGGIAVVLVGIGLIAAASATGSVTPSAGPGPGNGPGPMAASDDPLATVLAGQVLAVLVTGVLGVIAGAREYGSGLIRTTFTAAPNRLQVLTAKVLAFVGLTLPVMLLSVAAAFFAGMAVLDSGGAATLAWTDDGVLTALLGSAAYLVGIGVLGLCLGILTRSMGSGLGILVTAILIAPGLGSLLLPEDWTSALDYLPSQAASAFTSIATGSGTMSAGTGVAVFTAWLVGVFGAAYAGLIARDV